MNWQLVRPYRKYVRFVSELMNTVSYEMKSKEFLALVSGNPRSLKRICNVVKLAINLFKEAEMEDLTALQLLALVVLFEQWPFR